jgi:hypothetical protein
MSLTGPTVRAPKPPKPKVTADLRREVFERDGACVQYLLQPSHICADQWGTSHSPFALGRMTLEHVKDELQMGLRAPSDKAHMICVCWKLNLQPPSKEQREGFRAYLRRIEG